MIHCMNYFIDGIKKTFVFTGKASRAEFWYFIFLSFLISKLLIVTLDLSEIFFHLETSIFQRGWHILIGISIISLAIRRMHDIGKDEWFILVPVYNLFLFCLPSAQGENHFVLDSNVSQIDHNSSQAGIIDDLKKRRRSKLLAVIIIYTLVTIALLAFSLFGILFLEGASNETHKIISNLFILLIGGNAFVIVSFSVAYIAYRPWMRPILIISFLLPIVVAIIMFVQISTRFEKATQNQVHYRNEIVAFNHDILKVINSIHEKNPLISSSNCNENTVNTMYTHTCINLGLKKTGLDPLSNSDLELIRKELEKLIPIKNKYTSFDQEFATHNGRMRVYIDTVPSETDKKECMVDPNNKEQKFGISERFIYKCFISDTVTCNEEKNTSACSLLPTKSREN